MSYDLLLAEGCFFLAAAAGELDVPLDEAIGKQPKRYRAHLKHGLKHENPTALDRKHIELVRQHSKHAQQASGRIARSKRKFMGVDHNDAAEQHFKAAKIVKRAHTHFKKAHKPHLAKAMNHLLGHHIKAYKTHQQKTDMTDLMYAGKRPFRGVLAIRGREK